MLFRIRPDLWLTLSLNAFVVLGSACQKSSSKKAAPEKAREPVTEITPSAEPPPSVGVPLAPVGSEEPEPLPTADFPNPEPDAPPVLPVTETSPANPPVVPPVEPTPPPEKLTIKESQYWLITKGATGLSFNTPWDEEEGDGIIRDDRKVPAYAVNCQKEAETLYKQLAATQEFQAKIKPLLAEGATSDLRFLIVTVDSENQRDALRKIDRDAYFWHWNALAKKPVLAMNVFTRGTWVWEAIATPTTCTQPTLKDLGLYLDYAAKRLAVKGPKV